MSLPKNYIIAWVSVSKNQKRKAYIRYFLDKNGEICQSPNQCKKYTKQEAIKKALKMNKKVGSRRYFHACKVVDSYTETYHYTTSYTIKLYK